MKLRIEFQLRAYTAAVPALNSIEFGPTLRDDDLEYFATHSASIVRHSEVEDAVKAAPVDQLTSRLVPLDSPASSSESQHRMLRKAICGEFD